MDFKQWAIDRPLGEPGTTGYMMAEAAWAAAAAAEREQLAAKLTQAEYLIGAFERGADASDYFRDIAEFRA